MKIADSQADDRRPEGEEEQQPEPDRVRFRIRPESQAREQHNGEERSPSQHDQAEPDAAPAVPQKRRQDPGSAATQQNARLFKRHLPTLATTLREQAEDPKRIAALDRKRERGPPTRVGTWTDDGCSSSRLAESRGQRSPPGPFSSFQPHLGGQWVSTSSGAPRRSPRDQDLPGPRRSGTSLISSRRVGRSVAPDPLTVIVDP